MILLAYAVEKELAFWTPRPDVEPLRIGVGPVEAATAIANALARHSYTLVVNAGIAGAFDGAAAVGDGVVVADEYLELALETGEAIVLPDGELVADRTSSDPTLCAALNQRGFPLRRGVTVSRITSTDETAARLAELGAQVESMEGFAVLRAAEHAGVPAIEVRGISNRVGARERSNWNFDAGLHGVGRILDALFDLIDTSPTKRA